MKNATGPAATLCHNDVLNTLGGEEGEEGKRASPRGVHEIMVTHHLFPLLSLDQNPRLRHFGLVHDE